MTARPAASGNALAATAALTGLFALAVFGPALAPWSPLASNVGASLQPPSFAHWFGTDQVGRDLFSRVLVATRLDVAIAIGAVSVSFIVGSLVGAASALRGGWVDHAVGRSVDVLMAFPLFVVAMALVAVWGASALNLIAATAIINLPFYIRLARAEVAARRGAAYVRAARLGGAGEARVLLGTLLPNALPALVVQASTNLGWALLNGAGLSFLGLGVRPPTPEWGAMVGEGAPFMLTGQWWLPLFPSLALFVCVWIFMQAGDVLHDRLDPRRTRSFA